ncbi:NAD(P)/FAD-dependent oxidoreductase [Streptomyces sp. NBC_01622]|uniref:NAD(P)/FAD-dependent oxidoreductase n=1 Tax=Streptomyces sp. NBC_01622 TaxID=2975903 RepID=UPI00386BABA7|nr:NAD(P)/FAD-dependent oxidoreductase [Streptomyces sp. NBC_01622]
MTTAMGTGHDPAAGDRIVVVGASVAGVRAVQSLRARGCSDEIVLLDREAAPPYDKPALSKDLLTGGLDEPVVLASPAQLRQLAVDYRPGCEAVGLDLARRHVGLRGGASVPFGRLIIATGSRPVRLPGLEGVQGVHYLRTRADAVALRAAFADRPRVAVVGGGFIGGEVASSARRLGLEVTVVEAAERILARLMPPEVSEAVLRLHHDHGVEVRCGHAVRGHLGGGRVEALELDDGSVVPADVVVVGIGTVPDTAWLAGSGLDIADGVRCGPDLAAEGADGVYVAGDAARWGNDRLGGHERVEHWTAACEQAAVVARNLTEPGSSVPYVCDGYVWSDQHGVRIQHIGRSAPGLRVEAVPGSDGNGMLYRYLDGEGAAGATAVGAARDFLALRRGLAARQRDASEAVRTR